MKNMKAFIFNSGRGSRLGNLTDKCPKALLPLNDEETILSRQLRLLSKYGVKDFIITTGYLEKVIREAVTPFVDKGLRIQLVYNSQYESSNAIVSMYLARQLLCNDTFIVLHGDVVFDENWAIKAVEAEFENFAAIDELGALNKKDFKARLENQCISEVNVNLFGENCVNLMPFYKISSNAMKIWLNQVNLFYKNGQTDIYAEIAANGVWEKMNVQGLSYANNLLLEVDTPADLKRVRDSI